ncbi:MAG: serine/threonine-protein kinase [Pseudonocardiaceae bacterium]
MNAGTRLVADRYRLEQRIGTGAMGVVWRAHDERLDRTVAIKELLMQPGLADAEAQTARARAMREGRIAARLQHPNAICVYDVALDCGTGAEDQTGDQTVPWLVMEYLPSRSLATVLAEQGTLAPREAAGIGRQVAAALAAAHEAGIVHRDVKPGNVLLGHDGIVKITDFGISRASWDATVTCTGVLAGTPAYFAPEVVRGEPPGPASDVFSLGSTLYAAVEGEPPFGLDDNTLALLRTVADGRVRPPQRAGPLSAILMRLLADDPAARPSMNEAVAALGAAAALGRRGATPHVNPPMTTPTRSAAPAAAPPTAVDLLPAGPPRTPAWRKTATDRSRRWRPAMLFRTAGCLVLVAVVLAVVSNVFTAGRGQLTGARSGPPPVPGVNAAPTPEQQLPDSDGEAQPEQPQPAQLEQAVRTYYGLLPDDTDEAWQFLSAAERAKARGFAGYTRFWDGIDEVSIRGPVAVQGDTVLVDLLFEPANRKRTFERYRLTMGNSPDGEILIESAARIGGLTLTAAEPS